MLKNAEEDATSGEIALLRGEVERLKGKSPNEEVTLLQNELVEFKEYVTFELAKIKEQKLLLQGKPIGETPVNVKFVVLG